MEIKGNYDLMYLTGEGHSEVLAGVHYDGVMYYDLSKVKYINNSGMADLIDLVKSWMEMGCEVRFINVGGEIKKKFRDAGLDKILNYE